MESVDDGDEDACLDVDADAVGSDAVSVEDRPKLEAVLELTMNKSRSWLCDQPVTSRSKS